MAFTLKTTLLLTLWTFASLTVASHAQNARGHVSYTITDIPATQISIAGSKFPARYDIIARKHARGQWHIVILQGVYPYLEYHGMKFKLGTFGGPNTVARDINETGQITGNSDLSHDDDDATHAFIYSHGKMHDLGTFGGTDSVGYSINNKGQVTGYSEMTNPVVDHAFFYSDGVMHDIGTLGGADGRGMGINDKGQIVGKSTLSEYDYKIYHAFLYENGVMKDLNTLIDPNSGWTLETAEAISDRGEISGKGTFLGTTHLFFLTPIQQTP